MRSNEKIKTLKTGKSIYVEASAFLFCIVGHYFSRKRRFEEPIFTQTVFYFTSVRSLQRCKDVYFSHKKKSVSIIFMNDCKRTLLALRDRISSFSIFWTFTNLFICIVCTISFERPVNYLCDAWHVFPPKYEAWTHFNN